MKKRTQRMIVLTENTKTRLEHLLESARRFMRPEPAHLSELEEALDAAQTVASADIPGDVVTVNSTICITDMDSHNRKVFTLVFPQDANYSENRISVLAPLGAVLLGYRVGDIVRAEMPGGERRLKVEEVLFGPSRQPGSADHAAA